MRGEKEREHTSSSSSSRERRLKRRWRYTWFGSGPLACTRCIKGIESTMLDRYPSPSRHFLSNYHYMIMLAYLRLHKHQIDKQYHKIMFHIFIRKPLTPRTLCQPDIRTYPSNSSLAFIFRRLLCAHIRLRGAEQVRDGRFGSGCGALVVSAVEDVIELGDGIAAFNADWHAVRMLWITWWRVWWSCCCAFQE